MKSKGTIILPIFFHMIAQLFNIFIVINYLFASHSEQINYEKERDQILSIIADKYRECEKIDFMNIVTVQNSIKLLLNLDADKLLDALNAEESESFIITFLFGYLQSWKPILIFPNVRSLYPLKESPKKKIPLKRIFQNFRIFLFRTFETVSTIYSKDHSANYNLLGKFKDFWHNKLERLAYRLLPKEKFIKQSKLSKERFNFFYTFLDCGLEFSLIREFKGLEIDIKKNGFENSSAINHITFLVTQLIQHLNDFDSPNFLEKFRWLASQNPMFIIFVFYFKNREATLERVSTSEYYYLFSRNLKEMLEFINSNLSWNGKGLNLFENYMTDDHPNFSEISEVVRIILNKTDKRKISQIEKFWPSLPPNEKIH
jgi:hypothetical protein